MKSIKLLFIPLFFTLFCTQVHSQTHVNREWIQEMGDPDTLEWSTSITNDSNELYHVGNTKIFGEGANVLITKYDNSGSILWQEEFNTSNDNNDYGIAVDIDTSNNVYILGTTDNNTTYDYDYILLKYSATGNLIWDKQFDSGFDLRDVGTDLFVSDDGQDIYASVTSESSYEDFDFLTVRFDDSGDTLWTRRYDHNNMTEIPTGIDASGTKVNIIGASAESTSDWDYTLVSYETNGDFAHERREAYPGIGFDKPIDFVKDDNDNIYITGTASSGGINYDIRTIKLDADFDLVWDESVDFAGNYDAGHTIELDGDGNVYVGGVSKSGLNIDRMCFVKYDTSGTEVWKYTNTGQDFSEDATVRDVIINSGNEIYFLGDETGKNGFEQVALIKLDADGRTLWHRKINKSSYDLDAVQISFDTNENIYAVVNAHGGVASSYEIAYFTEFEQENNLVYDDTIPVFKDNELIVRFKQSALKTDIINNAGGKIKEFDSLQKFLTSSAMSAFDLAVQRECDSSLTEDNPCGIMAVKIFKQLTTTYDTTLSRMGEEIRVPDFWTTLLLVFPNHMEIETIYDDLQSIPDVVAFSEPNFIMQPTSDYLDQVSDDDWINSQESLFSANPSDSAHINILEAWHVYPEAGAPFIRCGILDDGVNYLHEDFGYEINQYSAEVESKVRDGYDFISGSNMFDGQFMLNEEAVHGTPSAGIIGAIRNNTDGIAGIAGGYYSGNSFPFSPDYFDDKGVSLYSLRIYDLPGDTFADSPIQSVYDAIVMSAIDEDTLDYGFGLHVSNNSWSIWPGSPWYSDSSYILLRDAIHFANRAKVSMVAARGNDGADTIANYPALMDDDWVLTVVGTGNDGKLKDKFNGINFGWTSSYGGIIDVGAPCINEMITTTMGDDPSGYSGFNGTSAAAPHVTGLVSLLLSYLNDSIPNNNNLAPEDCEHIIEMSAQNYYASAPYNDSVGWGLINAGGALRLVEKPWNTVHHFASSSEDTLPDVTGFSTTSLGSTIELREQTQNNLNEWFDKGEYDVNIFRYYATVQHGSEIDAIDTVVAYWGRASSTNVLEPVINDSLLARERLQIDYLDRDSCVMHGFVYELLDDSGNHLGWLPEDTSSFRPRFEYTVLTRDSTAPVVNVDSYSNLETQINLYPNPTTEMHTLQLEGFDKKNLRIEMYDVQGRKLSTIYDGAVGKAQTFEVNVSHLNAGLYLYMVVSEDFRKTIRFIKK